MIFGIFDVIVVCIMIILNILLWKKFSNDNGCLLTGTLIITYGFVLPITSMGIEIDKVTNERDVIDNFTLLYTYLKFPMYWVIGIIQLVAYTLVRYIMKSRKK